MHESNQQRTPNGPKTMMDIVCSVVLGLRCISSCYHCDPRTMMVIVCSVILGQMSL